MIVAPKKRLATVDVLSCKSTIVKPPGRLGVCGTHNEEYDMIVDEPSSLESHQSYPSHSQSSFQPARYEGSILPPSNPRYRPIEPSPYSMEQNVPSVSLEANASFDRELDSVLSDHTPYYFPPDFTSAQTMTPVAATMGASDQGKDIFSFVEDTIRALEPAPEATAAMTQALTNLIIAPAQLHTFDQGPQAPQTPYASGMQNYLDPPSPDPYIPTIRDPYATPPPDSFTSGLQDSSAATNPYGNPPPDTFALGPPGADPPRRRHGHEEEPARPREHKTSGRVEKRKDTQGRKRR